MELNSKEGSYIIKYKGKQIKKSNGKSCWKRIGDAKNAFRIEMENFWRNYKFYKKIKYIGSSYKEDELAFDKLYEYVLVNLIRFERVS